MPPVHGPLCLVVVCLFAGACAEEDLGEGTDSMAADSDTDPVPRDCVAPPGLGAPTTIDGAMTLINALPMPVSLPCFVESLDRPLSAYATTNDFSAQPAEQRSPRVFLFSAPLTMTIVFDGAGRGLLEFGEAVDERRSLKGELEFPIETVLPASAPYDQVRVGSGTSCAICHEREERAGELGPLGAYMSEALQPPPDTQLSISFVKAYAADCDPAVEPERCALLTATFAHGDVEAGLFPPATRVCMGL